MKRVNVAIAVIEEQGKILICQRRAGDSFGGLWEFPGGKLKPSESPQVALHREILEELGIRICSLRPLPIIEHAYPHVAVRLLPYLCHTIGGAAVQPLASQALKWIEPAELSNHAFPQANRPLLDEIMAHFAPHTPGAGSSVP